MGNSITVFLECENVALGVGKQYSRAHSVNQHVVFNYCKPLNEVAE
jgi:hypothetical protein